MTLVSEFVVNRTDNSSSERSRSEFVVLRTDEVNVKLV
jgi:hypothetical protein